MTEQEKWVLLSKLKEILREAKGCKLSGEDCTFHRCHSLGECQQIEKVAFDHAAPSPLDEIRGKYPEYVGAQVLSCHYDGDDNVVVVLGLRDGQLETGDDRSFVRACINLIATK